MVDDSNYKRIEDKQWRESVATRLVSLTDSEVTQNDRLDEQDDEIKTIKEMLEGKSGDRNDNGIKGEIHELATGLTELRRLMAPDHLGQGGIINRLKALERKAGMEEIEVGHRWKFRTAVAVAIVSLIGILLTNLDRIEPYFKKVVGQTIEQKPARRTTPKRSKPKRRAAPAIEVPTEAPDEPAKDEVPE